MEFFHKVTRFPFMATRRRWYAVSAIVILASIIALAVRGLNFGIDFTGGVLLEVGYPDTADLVSIRGQLAAAGFSDAQVQNFGTSRDVMIRLPPLDEDAGAEAGGRLGQQVLAALRTGGAQVDLRRVEFVGPQVGKELYEYGALALLVTAAGIVLYLWMRFEWRFGVAAIIANLHDVVIILGFFAFFQWEFGLPVLAAVLAILGYSVNESVVIADRIRENFRKMRKASVETVIDNAITSTISRTMITHGSTLLMVLSIFFFAGVGNASTFKQMPMIFERRQAGGVIGWTSAIAAYGPFIFGVLLSFIAPTLFFGLGVAFAAIAVGITWWYYARPGAEKPCFSACATAGGT